MPLLVLVAIIWTDFIVDKFIEMRSQCCCISFVSIESYFNWKKALITFWLFLQVILLLLTFVPIISYSGQQRWQPVPVTFTMSIKEY